MYCPNCGNKIKDNELYCTSCGKRTKEIPNNNINNPISIILAITSCIIFWIPVISIPLAIIAIIIAIVNNNNKALSIIISIISVLLSILEIILLMLMFTSIKNIVPKDMNHNFKKIIEEKETEDIKGYSWITTKEETIYLNNNDTYEWHKENNINEEGEYRLYSGEIAINYIIDFLKEFNITEEEQRSIIEDNNINIKNYYLIKLESNKEISYYYGYLKNDYLNLTNIKTKEKLKLLRKGKISNIDI